MNIEQLLQLSMLFEEAGLDFWIDGGWGVDVLLGKQTRPHSDLDLAVKFDDMPAFQTILERAGYSRADRPYDPYWNWVIVHPTGISIDLHGFVLDAEGNGILADPADQSMYPAGALAGMGTLGGMKLRCIAAPFVLMFRNGFEPRAVDYHDVANLCAGFSIKPPSRFQTDPNT
jgi:lincosamide nucleotidyltransferase A/C/D/E